MFLNLCWPTFVLIAVNTDQVVWGQHMQMLGIAIQECRALESVVWRSRLSSAVEGLTESAISALSSLDEVKQQQLHIREITAKSLQEVEDFRARALQDHENLRRQSNKLFTDLDELHQLQVKSKEQQQELQGALGTINSLVGSQV